MTTVRATVSPEATERATKPGNVKCAMSDKTLSVLTSAYAVRLRLASGAVVRRAISAVWQYWEVDEIGEIVTGINVLVGKKIKESETK